MQLWVKVWLVGEGTSKEEQEKATKGTLFIPFSQFPLKQLRGDCIYHTTPALVVPKSLANIHSCEVSIQSYPIQLIHVVDIRSPN